MIAKTNELNFEIKSLLKQFKLPDIYEKYEQELQASIDNNIGYREFLHRLLKIEEEGKKRRLTERNIKKACFDRLKSIEGFDFDFPDCINKSKILDLATLSFMDKNENLVFIGPPGVGKSHLAVAIGLKACEKGKSVLFVDAIELVDDL